MDEPPEPHRGRQRSADWPSRRHETVRVLHVDDPDAAETTAAALERNHDSFDVVTAPTPAAGLDRLSSGAFDCVVSDYDMPGMDGLSFYRAVRDRGFEVPFVLFTGAGSEAVASEAFAAGVSDYVRKEPGIGQYAALAARVERTVDHHRSRAALAASQERLSLFVQQSPLGVLEYDENFEIVGVNPAGEEILGYHESELVGHTWETLVTEESYDNVDRVTDALSRAEGGWHSVDENVRADGEVILCEWHNRVVTDDGGDVVAVFSQFQDVTERVEREERLEAATERLETVTNQYEALLETFPDGGVFMFDEDLTYIVAGGQGLSAVGLTEDDFLGRTPFDLFPEDIAEETARNYRRALAGEQTTYEQEYDGSTWRVRTRPVTNDDGEVVAGMAVSRNVTEQKRRIDQLNRQKERLEEFASVVSHDLRNPLNVAEGRLELAMADGDETHLAAVERAHGRMRDLIDDLLTLAQAERAVDATTPQSVAALASAAWQNVETGEATLEADDLTVLADRSRLQRLFENLVRNAVEHGGEAVTVRVGAIGDEVVRGFYVEDDGLGIPPERREAAFEVGYSTHDEGTGFGLRIVERVAAAHDWTVTLTESADGGARFEFRGVSGAAE